MSQGKFGPGFHRDNESSSGLSGPDIYNGDKISEKQEKGKMTLYEDCSDFHRLVGQGSDEEVEESQIVN